MDEVACAAITISKSVYRLYTAIEYVCNLGRLHMPILIRTKYSITNTQLADRLNTTICHAHRCSWM